MKHYPINEDTARRAKEAISFSDYRPGSATAGYQRMVDEAAEIAERQKKKVDPKKRYFTALVKYRDEHAAFELEIYYKGFPDDHILLSLDPGIVGGLELIGNIHDNPELLEVGT